MATGATGHCIAWKDYGSKELRMLGTWGYTDVAIFRGGWPCLTRYDGRCVGLRD